MNNNESKITGTLKVSANAIVGIAEAAAAEIKGVAVTASNKLAGAGSGALKEKLATPIRVKLASDSVSIDVYIVVMPSAKASNVAKAVQNNVKSVVQNMTGIAVSKVNVSVEGILAEEN